MMSVSQVLAERVVVRVVKSSLCFLPFDKLSLPNEMG